MTAVPTLFEARRGAMEHAMTHWFRNGQLTAQDRDPSNFFAVLHLETMFAALAAYEYTDASGPFPEDARLLESAVVGLEGVSQQFQRTGVVGNGDMNTPYFCLVPFTRAMLKLKPHVDSAWWGRVVDCCVKLFADAVEHIDRTHDYLNPRGLEAVSALGLHRLTGEKQYLDRSVECLDQLLTRIYPCGAQPYHTGRWVWGRSPAQVYQFLTAVLMLSLGFELDRPDAVEYVRRIMDYSLIATDRRGEAFITVFESLGKSHSHDCAGKQWAIALALKDDRFRDLARTTYEIWVEDTLNFQESPQRPLDAYRRRSCCLSGLNDALYLGVTEVPQSGRFVPRPGHYVFPDISSVLVHEEQLDIAMTLLTGYSAFAEADCGDVKLYTLTVELTDEPTPGNAGTDAMRTDWRTPSEQIECAKRDGKTLLKGRVFTKWQGRKPRDFSRLHNRFLEVTMTYGDGEMVLDYQTINDTSPEPVSSRLLFLLLVRPRSGSPRLQIAPGVDIKTPSPDSDELFEFKAPVGTVRFSAPDGSTIEIVPEICTADCILAERPSQALRDSGPARSGDKKRGERELKRRKRTSKPANEGSLRLCFEGANALDRGRYRIRFLPASGK